MPRQSRLAACREIAMQDVTKILERELATYAANRERLLEEHEGRYVLIHGDEIYATFVDQQDAFNAGYREWGNVPFLVQKILKTEEVIYI
jgi:hypothetical protein